MSYGFSQVGISDVDLSEAEGHLKNWIAKRLSCGHGLYAKHGSKRTNPQELVEEQFDCFLAGLIIFTNLLFLEGFKTEKQSCYFSFTPWAKVITRLSEKKGSSLKNPKLKYKTWTIGYLPTPLGDGKAIAEKSQSWISKHSNLINSQTGSYFFWRDLHKYSVACQ